MPKVRFEQKLQMPPALAFQALGGILKGIARQEGGWEGFALHASLGDAHLPDVGYVTIPILLKLQPASPGLQQRDLTIEAARHPESFPVFHGSMGIDATGPGHAMLWLAGNYKVPMHTFGLVLNATIAGSLADRALENFMEDIERACKAHIEKAEGDYARYQFFRR